MTASLDRPHYEKAKVEQFIREAAQNRSRKKNEEVVRQLLVAHLSNIFPTPWPWWVTHHIHGAEAYLQYLKGERSARGRGDSVVGATAIEYESDLGDQSKFDTGYGQVEQYCAGLLNQGVDPVTVRGILSDTVEWRAYELKNVPSKAVGTYGQEDIQLREIQVLVCDPLDSNTADSLVDFWLRHLGREGARPLSARSLAEYLAPTSVIAEPHLSELTVAIQDRMEADPNAANLVAELWTKFVSYLSENVPMGFDKETYIAEYYVAVLARLICTNIIERRALRSNSGELDSILNGQFFTSKGVNRLVEYDYFGWLTTSKHIAIIRPFASSLQAELAAFDFSAEASEDLFGEMVTQFAGRKQRLLLGQEWTPNWLASRMADSLFCQLGDNDPRFLDMCCGSGGMIVEVTKRARAKAKDKGLKEGSQEALDYLENAATGFDIDPLAVILAKVNWVAANRDWLEPFQGRNRVSVPIYHADSLFALAPVFENDLGMGGDTANYTLHLDDLTVELPSVLITPDKQQFFDDLLERVYRAGISGHALDDQVAQQMVAAAAAEVALPLDSADEVLAVKFAHNLSQALRDLHLRERNGVWVFVIRNSYRPSLVIGQFNGLISNPPWLALSRIANNPFDKAIKDRASRYGLRPAGSAFLHLDMSTTFLAYAVDRYLDEGAVVGCILPGTVRRGAHHKPFREQVGRCEGIIAKFDLDVDEVWQVARDTFNNIAIVVLGKKGVPVCRSRFTGFEVGPERTTPADLYVLSAGDRLVWSNDADWQEVAGYPAGYFQQGADLMPRTCVFIDAAHAGPGRVTISAPRKGSDTYYLVNDAKEAKGFKPVTKTVPERFLTKAWISKHLSPFDLADASPALVPVERDVANDSWREMPSASIVIEPNVEAHFEETIKAAGENSTSSFFARLDVRSKLSRQQIGVNGWLVVYGAGGGIPAAAYRSLAQFRNDPVMIDQTLYWAVAATEDEALYIVGLINSSALLDRVKAFAPEGLLAERHLHKLPALFVPVFDHSNQKHLDLVIATKTLISELCAKRVSDPSVDEFFAPRKQLSSRRRKIREVIEGLPGYGDYDAAADHIYA